MPRSSDRIWHFETYPELLRDAIESNHPQTRVTVHNRSMGGAPISALYKQFAHDSVYVEQGTGIILVIQCGIVDCAPRPIPPAVKTFIGRVPALLRWPITRLLHYARPIILRSGLKWRNTEIEQFKAILIEWLRKAGRNCDRIYVINIVPTFPAVELHSPGLQSSIDSYNHAIQSAVAAVDSPSIKLVDAHEAISLSNAGVSAYVNPHDGHHITHLGHSLYANTILALEKERLAG